MREERGKGEVGCVGWGEVKWGKGKLVGGGVWWHDKTANSLSKYDRGLLLPLLLL